MNEIPLEVFTDYVCPWCYLGDARVKKIKENFNIKIKLVHFPLHPETPKEGRTLLELFRTSPEDIKEKNLRMKGLMEQENLPYNDRTHTYNSRLAQEVGAWAETIQPDTTIHDKFYEAYFVNGLNVGLEEVILDVVSKSNLDVNEAKSVILNRTFKSHIDKDWEKSGKYGVTGVPTFVYEGQSLVGAQPYESLERFLNHFGIKSN